MIAEYLGKGAKNAITCERLCELTGINRREVLRKIETERDEGTLICANRRGYYLPEKPGDVADFYRRYTKRCRKQIHTVRHFKAEIEKIEGQESLF